MKAKVTRDKKGPSNTHFVVRVGMASIGKLYIPNAVADSDANREIAEFEIELPFVE